MSWKHFGNRTEFIGKGVRFKAQRERQRAKLALLASIPDCPTCGVTMTAATAALPLPGTICCTSCVRRVRRRFWQRLELLALHDLQAALAEYIGLRNGIGEPVHNKRLEAIFAERGVVLESEAA